MSIFNEKAGGFDCITSRIEVDLLKGRYAMALSPGEQTNYILNKDLRRLIKEISYKINEETRKDWARKGTELSTTDVYRKLVYEVLKRKGVMEVRELLNIILESGRISEDIITAFFISNLMLDPDPEEPLVMFQENGKTYIGFLKQLAKKRQ